MNEEVDEIIEETEEKIVNVLKKDEITDEDMEEIRDMFDEAYNHPDSTIATTITVLGPRNQIDMYLKPEQVYDKKPRKILKKILSSETKIEVKE